MYEYRVTKYNPQWRDAKGVFCKEDWTSICDIGKTIAGRRITESEYMQIESAYVDSALRFLELAQIPALKVCGLEDHNDAAKIAEGEELATRDLAPVLRDVLREKYWCRLERTGEAFVHVGYDYYMYIGVAVPDALAIQYARDRGLFVEAFRSPYHAGNGQPPGLPRLD